MFSPDVGISIPVQNMVENSLEKNGPKILLPQIIEAVTSLQKTSQETVTNSTKDSLPLYESQQVDSIPADSALGKNNSELGPLDLPLPISIPGLNASGGGTKKEGGGGEAGVKSGSKKEGTTDPLKSKAKTKASSDSSGGNKEAKQGGLTKTAPQKASLGKAIGKEKSKQKEKEGKSPVDQKEESKDLPSQNEDDQLKEKGRGTTSGKVKKTLKEEKLGQREKESEKQLDKRGITKESATADPKEVVKKEPSGKKDLKDGNRPELTTLDQTTKDVVSRDDQEDGRIEDEVEAKGSGPVSGGNGGSRGRRKQLAPKRRSARLASLNEESAEEQTANEKTKSTSQSAEEVKVDANSSPALQETVKKKTTVAEKTESAATSKNSGRKRICVLQSSSDEESLTTQRTTSEDEEKGYESETEQSKEEEVRKRKRKRAREGMKRARNREAVQPHVSDSSRGSGQKRLLGACKDDKEERRSNSPVTKKVKRNSGKQLQEERKLSPAKQKSPSPVVVTR